MSIPDSRGKSLNQKVQRHPDGSKELWRDIPGYKGFYRVSDRGRVISLDRVIIRNGSLAHLRPKFLKLGHLPKSGRPYVFLCKGGEKNLRLIHRLVLEAFVGPRPEGMECCHFPDRDPHNNRLENLRWDTPRANRADSEKHGTADRGRGMQMRLARMTIEERARFSYKCSVSSLKAWAAKTPEQRSEIARKREEAKRRKKGKARDKLE